MSYLLPIGFSVVIVTAFVQLTWIIFSSVEKGPPPDWSLYPLPPGIFLMMVGSGWWVLTH